jgi:Mrp family chromosome partitioning ATPase
MGKVYEALSRAQADSEVVDLFERGDVEDIEDHQGDADLPGRFSFMRYSLGSGTSGGRNRALNGTATEALVQRSAAKPGRELTIDPRRIDPHLTAFNNFDPRASQEFNKLALSLISKSAEKGFKRVLVASAQPGDGRTCVTLNLACALSRARQRVLVVDCDLDNPSVMRMLGLSSDTGLREAFERGLNASDAAVRICPYGFNVLPATRPIANPTELLAAPGFWKMLQTFDVDHDFILFDSSPLANGSDSSLLVRFTDTTLMVIRSGRTTSNDMARAIAPFSQDDILGAVINRTRD